MLEPKEPLRQTNMFRKSSENVMPENVEAAEIKKNKPGEADKESVPVTEWGMMVSGGSYVEESDVWLEYGDGKWLVDGKETNFQEVMSAYGGLLRKRAEVDEKLRELLEQSK